MLTVLAVLAALAVLFAAGALITHEGEVLRDAPADAPDVALPLGQLQPEDVPQLRFGLALRGYRMDEVDATLARVARELTARDQHIAQLQQALAEVVEPALVEMEQQDDAPVELWTLPEAPAPEPEQAAWPTPSSSFAPPDEAGPSADAEHVLDAEPVTEPEPAAEPDLVAPPSEPAPRPQEWPQEWPEDAGSPETTSAVADSPEQLHAPTTEPVEDLFPEIAPPEPDVQGLPEANDDEAPPASSLGLHDQGDHGDQGDQGDQEDQEDQEDQAPLGQPGVGFAASGGAPTDPV